MDFNSLGNGSPFYVLRQQGDKPILQVGIVKQKSQPRAKWPTQTPNIMQGMQMQQVIDLLVTIDGKDENFPEIPLNAEIAQRGNATFSGSREATLQAIDAKMQASKKHIEETPLHEAAIPEYEKMMEVLNPQYAEGKQQARTIKSLEERQDAQDKKLDNIYALLQKISGGVPKTANP